MGFKRFWALAALVSWAAVFVAPAHADPYRIVGLGDSLMAGYQLAPGESLPEQLEAALKAKGHDVVIANAGVSGDTSAGGLTRLDWSVPDGTQMVLLELGANDMLRGLSPQITEANLREIIDRLKARGVAVVLGGMYAAPNLGQDYADAFNAIYPALASEYGLPFYKFMLDGVATNAALLLADGMHPNRAGVARIVEGILPVMEAALPPASGG